MAQQEKSDSEKRLFRGTRRRSVLRAGLAVPLGSSVWLAACGGGGGGSDPFVPAPAATTTPDPAPQMVASAPATVQVPPIDPPPAKPVQEAVKQVRVLNFHTPTAPTPARQRAPTEDMKTYATRALQSKFELLRDALAQGLPKKTSPAELCYFVAPEFFWNVNWDAVRNEEDIKIFSDTCVIEVKKHVRALISLFPQEQFGKLTLLPGTAQVLIKLNHTVPNARLLATADDNAGILLVGRDGRHFEIPFPGDKVYEAFNYVLAIDNFSKPNPDGAQPMSMWPKRTVSSIDFPHSVDLGAPYWVPRLGKLDILVLKTSSTDAFSNAGGSQFPGFDNDPLGGVPFGVDICLDYMSMYDNGEYKRMSQIEDTNYVIDFLIASGMSIAADHNYLPSVQYIVRNDGANHAFGLGCEIFRLSAPATKEKPGPRHVHKRVRQTVVANPRGAANTLFDSYFDVHPNAGKDAPKVIDDLPSPIGL